MPAPRGYAMLTQPSVHPVSRRDLLKRLGGGMGIVGLSTVLGDARLLAAGSADPRRDESKNPLAPRSPHYAPRAKRVIFLFMNGGPSHVDTFDPKPELTRLHGQPLPERFRTGRNRRNTTALMKSPFRSQRHGQSGIEVSEIYPELARCVDDLCVVRSMWTDNPNHEPGLLLMNSGNMQPIRPSMGSWITYALGSENQNLPGFIVLRPRRPVAGPQLWSNSFPHGIYLRTHSNNRSTYPHAVIRAIRTP